MVPSFRLCEDISGGLVSVDLPRCKRSSFYVHCWAHLAPLDGQAGSLQYHVNCENGEWVELLDLIDGTRRGSNPV